MKSRLLTFPVCGTISSLAILFFCSWTSAQDVTSVPMPGAPPRNQRSAPGRVSAEESGSGAWLPLAHAALSFKPSVQVNRDTGNHVNDFAPVIAVSNGGSIYVVWNGDETTKSILFSRSTDGGTSFSPPQRINDAVPYPPSYSVYQPDIALDSNGTIYVVWHDYRQWAGDQSYTSPIDVFIDRSTDGGLTWGTDIAVSSGAGTYPWHFQPSIAVEGRSGNIFVAFTDYDRYYPQGDPGDVSMTVSWDRGASFQPKVRVDDAPDSLRASQGFSSVCVNPADRAVLVVFDDTRNGGKDIFLGRSTDSARSFLPNVRVNQDTSRDQEEPSIRASRAGHLFAVWKDWSADPTPTEPPFQNNMVIARSTNGGGAFSPGVVINDVPLNAAYGYNFPPRLALDDSGRVHVTWFDSRLGYTNCYYDHSVDGGASFSGDVLVNDNRDSLSHSLPRISVSAGHVYLVYMDKRNGQNAFDIFFTANDPLTSTGEGSSEPTGFRLEQNFPNPFNPTTTIGYGLPQRVEVTFSVYDLLGRLVASLQVGEREAGYHQLRFDARGLASGVYFYRLRAGEQMSVRRFILAR